MSASSTSEATSTKSSFTEKEAHLLKVCMDNLTDGRAGLLKQFDFEKVYLPAGYASAAVARNMLGRLLDKIADGQVPGTLRRNPRASKGKAKEEVRAAEDADHHSEEEEAALAAAEAPAEGSGFTPINRKDTPAKRKKAEDTVTSKPKRRSKQAKKVVKDSEETKATGGNASIQEDMKTRSVQKNDEAQDELPNQGKDELLC